jgi:hypothetical protein
MVEVFVETDEGVHLILEVAERIDGGEHLGRRIPA